jgi:2-polyprenyl-6-methoxyphenol hydroxylase-like FAD-dependent oxidoreductase
MLAPNVDNRKVIVVGAGPGGLAAAIGLRRSGLDVVVCEKAAGLKSAGSGLTLWPNASRALDAIGMLTDVTGDCLPLAAIAMKNWRDRELFSDRLSAVDDGGRFVSVGMARDELISRLARGIADAIRTGACLVGIEQTDNRVVARLADGSELAGDFLVAADGLHSVARRLVVRNDSPLVYAGYTVWRGIANAQLGHAIGTTWMGPGKQFGLFPISGERAYWFASCKAHEGAIANLGTVQASVKAAMADAPGIIPDIVAGTDEAAILQTDVYDRAPLAQWVFGRVVLLGDAAHPAQPTLGQGACQAMEDAAVLAAVMSGGRDVPDALRIYARRRTTRANGFVAEAHRLGDVGLWQSAPACWLRDRLMGAMPVGMRRKQLAKMFAFDPAPATDVSIVET